MVTRTRPPGCGVCAVELDATVKAVHAARSYVVDMLAGWGVPEDVVDTARLLTSELASNAILHGSPDGGGFTIEVRSFGCCLSVEAIDGSLATPVVRAPASDVVTGRGLWLVAHQADSWGYYFAGGRKHVWFHLRMPDDAEPSVGYP